MFFEVIGTDLFIGELSVSFSQIGTFAACTAVLVAYFASVLFVTK